MISVIIPAYNIAPYLDRCLKSVVNQRFDELEIIIVDDGSTDGTSALADAWSRRDGRVKVIHQANGGLSAARNAGLDVCHGEFITFIDGDDALVPGDALGAMLNEMNSDDVDVVVGKWESLSNKGVESYQPDENVRSKATTRYYDSRRTLLEIFYQKRITQSAWGRLFRREIFHTLRFPEGMLYEDLAVAYPLYGKIRRLAVVGVPCYLYVNDRKGSILNEFNPKRAHVLDILDDLLVRVSEEAPWLTDAVKSRRLSAAYNMLRLAPKKPEYQSLRQRAWNIIDSGKSSVLRDPNVRLKNKLAIVGTNILGKKIIERIL